jgi:hypothetical protein
MAGAREREHVDSECYSGLTLWEETRRNPPTQHAARSFPLLLPVIPLVCYWFHVRPKEGMPLSRRSGLGDRDLWNLACKRFPASQITVLRIWPVKTW